MVSRDKNISFLLYFKSQWAKPAGEIPSYAKLTTSDAEGSFPNLQHVEGKTALQKHNLRRQNKFQVNNYKFEKVETCGFNTRVVLKQRRKERFVTRLSVMELNHASGFFLFPILLPMNAWENDLLKPL